MGVSPLSLLSRKNSRGNLWHLSILAKIQNAIIEFQVDRIENVEENKSEL
jgi:hypothetical protein